ncbi:MAG: transglycosylase SLT domain-containing protein [Gammaproteobacteria bacterium]|nr:transglycosylase SLT domain-containing protein [Gammaproteobacteria bacterium]MBQ0775718.1 transglycosylase SLT domain-containing protein [Gammaproteobacteria bacterium]
MLIRWPLFIALFISLSSVLSSVAHASESEQTIPSPSAAQVALAERAFLAAKEKRWNDLAALEAELPEHFPLAPYLSYQQIRANVQRGDDSLAEVQTWLRKHDHSPLADQLRDDAMSYYGSHRQWSALRAVSEGVPRSSSLRCYYYQSLLSDDRSNALRGAKQLWLSGQSRPNNCDALFNELRASGQLDDELTWQRMVLAFHDNNSSLMRYLRSTINSKKVAQRADTLLRLYEKPRETRVLMPNKHNIQLALSGLHRLADKDPVYARQLTPIISKRFSLSDDDQNTVLARIAWFSTIRDLPNNKVWLEKYLAGTTNLRLLEQRARRAVIDQDWVALNNWINALPKSEQNSSHWRYWRARSLSAQNKEGSDVYLRLAASERNFWGFLAAQRLGTPYQLNDTPAPSSEVTLNDIQNQALNRIQWLVAMNEVSLARTEWLHLMRQSDNVDLVPLGNIALANKWFHFSVETAIFSRQRNVLSWRFPAAMQEEFEQAGKKTDVDPWLLMAVSRRESAFNPHARSHVGATGLMQLMPATARQVADQIDMPRPDASSLREPDINLRLGSQYLSDLLKRYNGNRVLALAAYNAGPHRIDRWLADTNVPFDVFIESIPFYETREYVQAVLAYRVILSRHGKDDQLAELMLPSEKSAVYSPLLLAAKAP